MDDKQSLKFYITKNKLLEDEIEKSIKHINGLVADLDKVQANNRTLIYKLDESEKERKSLQENLNDISDVHSNVMDEKCWPDEKHCTCVPFLRVEIDKLKNEREILQTAYRSLKMKG